MKNLIIAFMIISFGTAGQKSSSGSAIHDTAPERIVYSVIISGFALSDSADGPESAISWNQVESEKFLHIHAFANLPDSVMTLQGKYRKLKGTDIGSPADDIPLEPGKRRPGGYFDFVITHYVLDRDTRYLVRAADDFSSKDIKCLVTDTFKTRK